MNVIAIGDEYFVTFFRLAGIRGIAAEGEELGRKVKEIVEEGKYDAVIVSEKNLEGIEKVRNELLRTGRLYPIFIVVPDLSGATGKRLEELYQMIALAVGVRLKLG